MVADIVAQAKPGRISEVARIVEDFAVFQRDQGSSHCPGWFDRFLNQLLEVSGDYSLLPELALVLLHCSVDGSESVKMARLCLLEARSRFG